MNFCQYSLKLSFQQTQGDSVSNISIFDVKSCFLSLSYGQRLLLSQVEKLLQFIFVMPSTNATSERSFSALRHLKSYLRIMMSQEWLNFLMLIYIHKDRTDVLDLKRVLNDFVNGSVHRLGILLSVSQSSKSYYSYIDITICC